MSDVMKGETPLLASFIRLLLKSFPSSYFSSPFFPFFQYVASRQRAIESERENGNRSSICCEIDMNSTHTHYCVFI